MSGISNDPYNLKLQSGTYNTNGMSRQQQVNYLVGAELQNKLFESMEGFKEFCGDFYEDLNIFQVYGNGTYNYYEVSSKYDESIRTTVMVKANAAKSTPQAVEDEKQKRADAVKNFINNELKGKSFNSIDEFKEFCGEYVDDLNIQQVYGDAKYNYYEVTSKYDETVRTGITFSANSDTVETGGVDGTESADDVDNDDNRANLIQDFLNNELKGKTFNSIDEFKEFCGEYLDDLNINQRYEDRNNYYYEVSSNLGEGVTVSITIAKQLAGAENPISPNIIIIPHINDINEVFSLDDLKNKYKLTDKDISYFFKQNEDGTYSINKDAAKSCFGKNINSISSLADAMKNGGYSEGYVRGAYSFSNDDVAKYFTKEETTRRLDDQMYEFKLNLEAIKEEFPDMEINSIGQLKEALDAKRTAESVAEEEEATKKQDYEDSAVRFDESVIKDTYKFTDKDISMYFTKKDDKYIIKQDFLENNLSGKDIKTIEEFIEALKDAQYDEGYVKGLYGFSDDETAEFFTQTEDGKFVLNQNAVERAFSDEDIKSLGQLRDAISEMGYKSVISDENKSKMLDKLKDGFKAGDKDWGFGSLRPNEEQVENLYKQLSEDDDIKNFTGSSSDFKALIKTKAAEYIKDIKQSITVYTEGEIRGRFGFSKIQTQLFFTQNEDGTYQLDMDKVNDFWGEGYRRDTIEKVMEFTKTYGLGTDRKNKVCELYKEALINQDPAFGFDKLDPPLTDKEIESFYWQVANLDGRGGLSLEEFEKLISKKLPAIMNNVQLQRLDNMISGGELDKITNGYEVKEFVNRYAELYRNELKEKYDYTDEYLDSIVNFAVEELDVKTLYTEQEIENAIYSYRRNMKCTYQYLSGNLPEEELEKLVQKYAEELKAGGTNYNLGVELAQLKSNLDQLNGYTELSLIDERPVKDENGLWIVTGYNEESKEIYQREKYNMWDAQGVGGSTFVHWIYSDDNKSIQEKYLSDLIKEKIDRLDWDEKDAFMNLVFDEISKQIGKERKYSGSGYFNVNLTQSDLRNLCKDGHVSWLDEFFDIVNQKSKNIVHIDSSEVENAQIIDTDALLNGSSGINADYIMEHLYELQLSSDPGIRKLVDILLPTDNKSGELQIKLFESLNTNDTYFPTAKYIDLLLSTALNKAGIECHSPIQLTKEILSQVNLLDVISDVIDNADVEGMIRKYIADGVDGVIEEVNQGETGDCWMMSAIRSLVTTEIGRDCIKNAIKWNEDETAVNVYFAGIDEYVKVSIDEICAAMMNSDYYSNGDLDVIVLEIAMEKIYGDIEGDYSSTFWTRFLQGFSLDSDTSTGLDDLVNVIGGWLGLGSGKCDLDKSTIRDNLKSMLNAKKNGQQFAGTFSLWASNHTEWRWTTVDGKQGYYSCRSNDGHCFAITDITDTTVTFVNPHDSAKMVYTVTWDEFINTIQPTQMQTVYLNTPVPKSDNIDDNNIMIGNETYNIDEIMESDEPVYIRLSSKDFATYGGIFGIATHQQAVDYAKNRLSIIINELKRVFKNRYDSSKLAGACKYLFDLYSQKIENFDTQSGKYGVDFDGLKMLKGSDSIFDNNYYLNIDLHKILEKLKELLD